MRARLREAFSVRANLRRAFVRPDGGARGRLPPLDGLRALSVLWVLVFHAGWYARLSLPPDRWLALVGARWMLPIWRGDFGVDLFFVLSGFLIAGLLLDEQQRTGHIALGLFYARRLLRLWPALLLVVLVDQWTDDPNRHAAWANAIYVNDFLPVGRVALAWTWSLAIEEQFYLVCPWILLAVAGLAIRARAFAVAALIGVLVIVSADVVVLNKIRPEDAEFLGNLDMRRWGFAFDVFYDKPWMRAGALLAGVLAALVYREPRAMQALSGARAVTVTLLAAALVAMGLATHWQLVDGATRGLQVAYLASFRTVFAVGAAFVLLLTLSANPAGSVLARGLSTPALYPLSQLAYSAYLVNPMVTMFVGSTLRGVVATSEHPMGILVLCDVVGTLAVATVIHVLVERPGMELRPTARARSSTVAA